MPDYYVFCLRDNLASTDSINTCLSWPIYQAAKPALTTATSCSTEPPLTPIPPTI